ncbi:MAG TPA: LptF/LptG family permease, partial [Chitinophagaceae bacterium]|nr:LptF/LptG family permease [Chitinophagaceae bacterium]
MIKKLDTLVLKAFIGPFIATFFVTLFVLILQFFWLYIDDIVGKNVDFLTIAQLIGWLSATLVPLALPLAILLSSIMTFGNLGETFELVAIKSAGISLLRFVRPLLFTSLLLCGAAFLFNNNIIPIAMLKMKTMQYDIVMSKPAFDLKEGVFYDKIDGYVIKIGKKEKDNSTIRNVIIYEKNSGVQDNMIVANSGEMKVSADKHSIEFNLKDGWRYEEQGTGLQTDYIRMGFKEYKKVFDLSSFQLNKTEDSTFKDHYRMLSLRQLDKRIDSLEKLRNQLQERSRTEVAYQVSFSRDLDTGWAKLTSPVKKIRSLKEIIPDSLREMIQEAAIG